MALKMTTTIGPLMLTVQDAYLKIVEARVSVKNGVIVRFAVYANQEASVVENVNPVATDHRIFPFPEDQVMTGANSIEWAYNQLKALPEFSEAIDV